MQGQLPRMQRHSSVKGTVRTDIIDMELPSPAPFAPAACPLGTRPLATAAAPFRCLDLRFATSAASSAAPSAARKRGVGWVERKVRVGHQPRKARVLQGRLPGQRARSSKCLKKRHAMPGACFVFMAH